MQNKKLEKHPVEPVLDTPKFSVQIPILMYHYTSVKWLTSIKNVTEDLIFGAAQALPQNGAVQGVATHRLAPNEAVQGGAA